MLEGMERREVLRGLGLVVLCGCGGGGDEPTPDTIPGNGFEMCGANLCVDLSHPSNAALLDVNGARAINAPNGDKLIVVRQSATMFAVLARTCTHNGCGVGYNPALMVLVCPCHGSRFALDGTVTRDPAIRNLKSYASTFDEATQTLTITL